MYSLFSTESKPLVREMGKREKRWRDREKGEQKRRGRKRRETGSAKFKNAMEKNAKARMGSKSGQKIDLNNMQERDCIEQYSCGSFDDDAL